MNRRDALGLLAGAVVGSGVSPRAQTPMPRSRRIISAGLDTYLIETDGTVKAWSLVNSPGWALGLGYDSRVQPYTAFETPGLRNVVDMASAINATYALLANGSIVSWGSNARGELGNTPLSDVERLASTRGNSNTPTPVLGISDAVQIAAGAYHGLAVTRGGEVFVWGYGLYEQLGFEMPIIQFKTHTPAAMQYLPFPLRVPGLRDVVAVAGGSQHSLALLKDGTIRAWGTNKDGQVGDGTTTTRKTPVSVIGVRNAVAIAAFSTVSAALLADGTVMTWGNGNSGLGRKTATRDAANPTPALVDGVTGITSLAIGSIHMVAVTDTGTVMSWGDNMIGEVGHRGTSPALIPGLTNVASVEAYTGRTFAVLASGTIMALGHVPFWARIEGGDPTVVSFPIPLVIKNLNNPL
jgi:alpha-tubulin suppressor-like RCC1 family protein